MAHGYTPGDIDIMLTTLRAALSLALLAGFYVYALVVAAASVSLALLLGGLLGYNKLAIFLVIAGVLTAVAVVRATWRVARAKYVPYGLLITEDRAPELWATVRELAAAVGTRPPDEIRLVPEVNAAVSEDNRLLGLRGGRRYLYLGLPLLQAFTVAQLRAVLAHELGHYSHQHVRLAEPVYRGRLLIAHTMAQLSRDRTWLTRWVMRLYAYFYFLVSMAVSRAQEIEADRASVRLAGRSSAIQALRELPGLSAAWNFYLESYVVLGKDTNLAPAGVLSHFTSLLEGRSKELAEIRASAPSARRSWWDSHPSDAERIAMMAREPDPSVAADERPARIFLPDLDAAAAELEEVTFPFEGRQRVSFEQYVAASLAASYQKQADRVYRSLARITEPTFPTLGTVLDLLAAGRADELGATLVPAGSAPEVIREATREAVWTTIVAGLCAAGAARWQLSWSGPAVLVDSTGKEIDHQQLVERALGGQATEVAAELTATGVDLAATAEKATIDFSDAQPLAALLNVVVNGKRQDLLILDKGLMTLPPAPYLL